jgi:hypothetical protein
MNSRLSLGPEAVADAEQFIHALIQWGEHHYDRARGWSVEDMRREIPDYENVLAEVRNGYAVRHFENLLSATWQTETSHPDVPGIGVRNPATGEQQTLDGVGVIEISSYAAFFETAVSAWRRALERESHAELLSAFRDGMASIEAYLNAKAAEWNARNPNDLLVESPQRWVSFNKKFERWIPKITGAHVDKTGQLWGLLMEAKEYRDTIAVHPKQTIRAVALPELARLLNLFTRGVTMPLCNLHQTFHQAIPAPILRAAFAPEVTVRPTP